MQLKAETSKDKEPRGALKLRSSADLFSSLTHGSHALMFSHALFPSYHRACHRAAKSLSCPWLKAGTELLTTVAIVRALHLQCKVTFSSTTQALGRVESQPANTCCPQLRAQRLEPQNVCGRDLRTYPLKTFNLTT